jgi:hypothetical protein
MAGMHGMPAMSLERTFTAPRANLAASTMPRRAVAESHTREISSAGASGHDFSRIPTHGRGNTTLLGGSEGAGDFFRPIDVFFSNIGGTLAGAFGGASVSADDTNGPAWDDHGEFRWDVNFRTSGKSGWLIQENKLSYRIEDARHNALPFSYPPIYFEAWQVDANSRVLPQPGDTWARPNMDKVLKTQTQGHWSTRSRVFFTKADPAKHGFKPGAVKEAGPHLPSSTVAPNDLGTARLHRFAQGHWDLSGKHEGKNG